MSGKYQHDDKDTKVIKTSARAAWISNQKCPPNTYLSERVAFTIITVNHHITIWLNSINIQRRRESVFIWIIFISLTKYSCKTWAKVCIHMSSTSFIAIVNVCKEYLFVRFFFKYDINYNKEQKLNILSFINIAFIHALFNMLYISPCLEISIPIPSH